MEKYINSKTCERIWSAITDDNNAMVIPSLIKRALEEDSDYLEVLGDGSPIDFIYCDMLQGNDESCCGIKEPINLEVEESQDKRGGRDNCK